MHFNALKYTQLLQEKAYGIKAGFKLDTDEGIRSREAHALTGKTWLQLMCHTCWGARAVDWKGRPVTLDINEGEYVNSTDMDRLGYKSSVQSAEHRTRASRFIGDMYRLIIFQELVRCLGVKDDIDPMPGVFAGELARCQAFFCLIYCAYAFAAEGDRESCDQLMGAGRNELNQLQREIDSGIVETKLNEEHRMWQSFIREVDALDDSGHVRDLLDELAI